MKKIYLYLIVFMFAMVSCQEASNETIDSIDTLSMENFVESVEPPIRQGEQCYKDNPNLHHRTDVYDIVSINDSVLLIVPRNEYGDIITLEI